LIIHLIALIAQLHKRLELNWYFDCSNNSR